MRLPYSHPRQYGGGIDVRLDGSLNMSTTRVTGNEAQASTSRGGGIFLQDAQANVLSSMIASNTAGSGGGGIQPAGAATLELTDTKLTNNQPDDLGGASSTCSSGCGAGHYGNCELADSSSSECPSCVPNACSACPRGKYRSSPGAAFDSDCLDCPKGYHSSSEGASTCEGPCAVGSYVTDLESDSDGYGVTSGGRKCVACPTGRYNDESGKAFCAPCPPGYSSDAGSTECQACPPGTFNTKAGGESCVNW